MKVAFLEVKDSEKDYLLEYTQKYDYEFIFTDEFLHSNNIEKYKDVDALCLLNKSFTTPEIIEQFDRLKLIATRSTGTDNLDLKYFNEKGIKVSNLPSYSENSVAEHTIGLIFTLSRCFEQAIQSTRSGFFQHESFSCFELSGKTLGVIGTGNIGQKVIKIANATNLNVIAYDLYPKYELESVLGFNYLALDELFAQSDIISLHLPYKIGDAPFINKETMVKMKDGVILINTARGGLIDSKALLEAVNSGKVFRAGLDVLQYEKYIRTGIDHPGVEIDKQLIQHPNVVVTPHSGYKSNESIRRLVELSVNNIDSFFKSMSMTLFS